MINIQRLEGFYWVATTGGYARAARAFPYPITQPAVHQQVKKLEEQLGVTLFERIGKDQMQLTPAGEYLFQHVGPFLRDLPAVERNLRQGGYTGRLGIHAEPMMLRHIMPAWLQRMRKRRADVRIDLREHREPHVEALRRGEADLLVGYFPDPGEDLASIHVATLYPFVVLPRGHAAAKGEDFDFAALGGETFIAYHEGERAHELQMRALNEHGLQPDSVLTTSSVDAILGLVASGLGFSLVPGLTRSGPSLKGLVALPLPGEPVTFEVSCLWRKDTPENPLLDLALETAPKP